MPAPSPLFLFCFSTILSSSSHLLSWSSWWGPRASLSTKTGILSHSAIWPPGGSGQLAQRTSQHPYGSADHLLLSSGLGLAAQLCKGSLVDWEKASYSAGIAGTLTGPTLKAKPYAWCLFSPWCSEHLWVRLLSVQSTFVCRHVQYLLL